MGTAGIVILSILGIIILFLIIKFNIYVSLRNKIKQSKSGIDVYLNQRFDLIPNLVECVKGYANYESQTFAKITELRSEYDNGKNLKKGEEVNSEFNKLLAISESNPNLKASEQFINLQKSLTKIENQLQAARRVYNGDVTLYNTTISTFPDLILAKLFGFKEEELFEIEEYKKENINIDL